MNVTSRPQNSKNYTEHIAVSHLSRLFLSGLLTTGLCIFVIPFYYAMSASPNKMLWVIFIVVSCYSFIYLIVGRTYGVNIKVSSQHLMDWSKGDVLHVRGTQKGEQFRIPVQDIESATIINFDHSNQPDIDTTESDSKTIHIFHINGYSGRGLAVTFRFKTLVSSANKLTTQVFPTRNAFELTERLGFSQKLASSRQGKSE